MRLTRFVVEKMTLEETRKVVHIGVLDFVATTGDCRISNMRPFRIEIEEDGLIRNGFDRVKISIKNRVKGIIRVDEMTIQSIVNQAEVQRKINELVGINKLAEMDAILQEVDELNVKVDAFIRGLEVELLLEDLLLMNREHAIDMALDTGDVETFMKLTGGRENELIETV